MQATYTKLRNGSWGVRVTGGKPKPGTTLTVRKKSGEEKQETVQAVVWSDGKVSLCSIAKSASKSASSGSYRPKKSRWIPCGYPGCSPHYCDECDGEGRYGSF